MNAHGATAVAAVHDELLEAMHGLELALAAPAPRRQRDWCERVAKELGVVNEALAQHVLTAEAPEGLFAEIEAAAPPLHHRIGRLKREHAQLLRQTDALEAYVAQERVLKRYAFQEIRQRAGWLLTGLRQRTALAADLVFELYDTDIGSGD
jgi:hypothetical protein